MSKVTIVTDSTTCIPLKLIDELNIRTIPYYIHRGSEVLRDLVNIECDSFYQWLPSASELQKLPVLVRVITSKFTSA